MEANKYRREVQQAIFYIGAAKMRMEDHVDLGGTRSSYTFGIRDVHARSLMASL